MSPFSTKPRLGKLPLPCPSPDDLPALVLSENMNLLPILPTLAVPTGSRPQEHRDPFDRMLAAQSRTENLTLVSADTVFKTFGIDHLILSN